MSFLGFLRGRPEATPAPPLEPAERKRLEHRRRRVAQALRQAERRVAAHNCASCLKKEEDPRAIALDRRRKELAAQLEAMDQVLGRPI